MMSEIFIKPEFPAEIQAIAAQAETAGGLIETIAISEYNALKDEFEQELAGVRNHWLIAGIVLFLAGLVGGHLLHLFVG